jgi:uncharacterized membrane protein YbhN (UPF0104 family)
MPEPTSSKSGLFSPRALIPILILVLALGLWLAHSHTTFDVHSLAAQLRSINIWLVLLACLLTYIGYWLRAWRWAVLLTPIRPTATRDTFPAQLIGFTIVGLFGRLSDLGRPYLIARRLGTPVATQLAVYSIERAFDLGAAAILFSVTLAFAPHNMPHHEAFARAGIVSLAATLFLAVFAVSLRLAGARIAALVRRLLHPISPSFATSAQTHTLNFSSGLRIVSNLREFLYALVLSLTMWTLIAFVYLTSAHAFRQSPELAHLTFAGTMLLLASGIGGSIFQLPILGWFTQIAVLAAALHAFFGVPLETASACGFILLITCNLAVIPGGLIAARLEGITLREATGSPTAATPISEAS